ncbi:MAG: SUMF1/EgtB/PvdO family nonheme iron enzyme [Bacteroidota bacterium]
MLNYELAHDSIARQVFDKASVESRTRRKMERFIRERHQAFLDRGVGLTTDDLDYIKPFLGQVNISREIESFIRQEQKSLLRQKQKRRLLVAGVIVALSFFSFIAAWQWYAADKAKSVAQQEKTRAEEKEAEAIAASKEAIRQKGLADSASVFATEQRDIAVEAQQEAEYRLAQVMQEKALRANILLVQFPEAIEQLDFGRAYQIVDEILVVNARPRASRAAVAEMIYYFALTDQLKEAFLLIEKANRLISPAKLSSVADSAKAAKASVQRSLSQTEWKAMARKYFPHLINVDANTFWMGGRPDERSFRKDEQQHQVKLKSYALAQTELSTLQYYVYAQAANVSMPKTTWAQKASLPISNISWYDALHYCNWLSTQLGVPPVYEIDAQTKKVVWQEASNGFRLPTEAEWMCAAGGGKTNIEVAYNPNRYAGGNEIGIVGWAKSNSQSQPQKVGSLLPNEWGFYDMTGNVWEWCWDLYDAQYYQTCLAQGVVADPKGPKNDGTFTEYVNLGGGFDSRAVECRINNRSHNLPATTYGIGLRICQSLP